MFGLATGLYRTYFSPANLSILIIGPDCAGKTALLERIKVTQFSTSRQLRTLAAAHGGNVPLPRSTSGRMMDGDDNGGGGEAGKMEVHRRHNSAPIVMDAKSSIGDGGDGSTVPPQKRGGDSTEKKSRADIGKSPNSADGPRAAAAATKSNISTAAATASGGASSSSGSGSFRRRFLVCPAPRMYSREAMTEGDDDEEEERYDEVVLSDDDDNGGPDATDVDDDQDPDSDLKSLLGDVADVAAPTTGSTHQDDDDDYNDHHDGQQQQHEHEEEEEVEHDVKKSARMLPLHLIRPTIGQNLHKMDACGCRINVYDLGGMIKMRPLWDRYYSEVDAVVFVVDARTVGGAGGSCGISRLEETVEAFDTVRDQDVLDGVPLMVFVNKIDRGDGGRLVSDDDDRYQQQQQRQQQDEGDGNDAAAAAANNDRFHPSRLDLDVLSNALNLYGHPTKSIDNDMIVMTAGSARTGEGVRAAFEWLVLKARNVQREMEVIDRKMTM